MALIDIGFEEEIPLSGLHIHIPISMITMTLLKKIWTDRQQLIPTTQKFYGVLHYEFSFDLFEYAVLKLSVRFEI